MHQIAPFYTGNQHAHVPLNRLKTSDRIFKDLNSFKMSSASQSLVFYVEIQIISHQENICFKFIELKDHIMYKKIKFLGGNTTYVWLERLKEIEFA